MSKTPYMQLWVPDFIADVQELDAREVGAYILLLMSMWQRGGSLPNDHKKLQRVARISRGWPKIWEAICPYFEISNGKVSNERLRKELTKARNKSEINSENGALGGKAKALKYNEATLANARNSPKQPEPESKVGGGGARAHTRGEKSPSADATWRERILRTIGVPDPVSGLTGHGGRMLGTQTDMLEAGRWSNDLGLSHEEILTTIAECMQTKRDGLPSKFSYFTAPMRRLAAEKQALPLQPAEGDLHGPQSSISAGASRHPRSGGAHHNLLAGFSRAADRFED
ncbi:hypothetical protein DL1_08645 [Thioclava dalianensis]|uniref:DUF1376 domain-containing protein n=1 Tax=Thioclava dalianensis TaxID=1185766 RepID=A0A074TII1_9RHOB|nr:DUF1376 domain-containing protein [Thioclava dalianensis]KEP68798.1 hypothetical protein DL1_08645 [Thioclava dalianensis]